MPMISLKCSKPIPDNLLGELSAAVAETLGKPEKYVMVSVSEVSMMMSGTKGDAAYAEVKSLGGLSRTVNHEITMKLCVLLSDHLGIPADRVYVTFTSLERDQWGWNGTLFG